MKALVTLTGLATLIGFTWFSVNGMQESISANLTTQANSLISKADNLEGVHVQFDHFDGVVYGAESDELQQQVSDALSDLPPMKRLVFSSDAVPEELQTEANVETPAEQSFEVLSEESSATKRLSSPSDSLHSKPTESVEMITKAIVDSNPAFEPSHDDSASEVDLSYEDKALIQPEPAQREDESKKGRAPSPAETPKRKEQADEAGTEPSSQKRSIAIRSSGKFEQVVADQEDDGEASVAATSISDEQRNESEAAEIDQVSQVAAVVSSEESEASVGDASVEEASVGVKVTTRDSEDETELPVPQELKSVGKRDETSGQLPFLGIAMNTDTTTLAVVVPGSSAAQAGLEIGDTILQIDKTKIANFDDLKGFVKDKKVGDVLRIWFRRDGTLYLVDSRLLSNPKAANGDN